MISKNRMARFTWKPGELHLLTKEEVNETNKVNVPDQAANDFNESKSKAYTELVTEMQKKYDVYQDVTSNKKI